MFEHQWDAKWTFKKMPLVRNLIRNVNCHGKHRANDRVCTAKPGSYLRPENSVLMGQHFSSHLVRVPLSDPISIQYSILI